MLRDSVVVVVAVMRPRPRVIPLAMITMRISTRGFRFLSYMIKGAPLGGPWGRLSSAMIEYEMTLLIFLFIVIFISN